MKRYQRIINDLIELRDDTYNNKDSYEENYNFFMHKLDEIIYKYKDKSPEEIERDNLIEWQNNETREYAEQLEEEKI